MKDHEEKNIIEHTFVLCREAYIGINNLPNHMRHTEAVFEGALTLAEMERVYIIGALEKNSGNKTKASEELGIDSFALWRKIKKLNIE